MTSPRLFNCTVSSINLSGGFNGQSSTLQLQLVEDPRANDFFIPGQIGTPVYFTYGSLSFGGILESWDTSISSGGRLIDVNIVDPRDILAGVYLILGEFNGPTSSVPNIMNIYGYLENTYGFGYSGLTVDGIKWGKVTAALNYLMFNNTSYGGAVTSRGHSFIVSMDNLPDLPEEYRVSGDMSLLDFISDICEAGNCDFIIDLVYNSSGRNEIRVRTMNRNSQPSLGKISQFVGSVGNASVRKSGLSLVNETSNKFLLGAKKRSLFYVNGNVEKYTFIVNNSNDIKTHKVGSRLPTGYTYYYDDDDKINFPLFDKYDTVDKIKELNILPYLGKDINKNAIVPVGVGDWMEFNIDTRLISMHGLGESYTCTIGELRAALAGYEVWTQYLWSHCFNEFLPKPYNHDIEFMALGVVFSDDIDTTTEPMYGLDVTDASNNIVGQAAILTFVQKQNDTYRATPYKNPHFRKAFELNLESPPPGRKSEPSFSSDFRLSLTQPYVFRDYFSKQDYSTSKMLWSMINKYAEDYYGKRFMVRVDDLIGASQDDTTDLIYNMEPVDSAYVDEDLFEDAVKNNLLPFNIQEFSDANGQVECFVRFDNFGLLDTSNMSVSDTALNVNFKKLNKGKKVAGPPYCFVKCQAEEVVFLDYENKLEPRVIVTLPYIPFIRSELDPLIENNMVLKTKNIFSAENNNLNLLTTQLSKYATDQFNLSQPFIFPDMVAIPLESNIDRYGPWYTLGADGPTEYIVDENLAPWNYNGYDNMNLVANATINDGPAFQIVESGTVEVPDVPALSIGDALVSGGPYITDIQVNFDANGGATTTYRMEIWKQRFGKLNKTFIDKVNRIQRELVKRKSETRGLVKTYLK